MRRDLIFDLGLHRGEDAEFYLRKGFSVVGVEANPELAREAGERLKEYIARGQLTIINKAIAAEQGPVPFFVSENMSVWGTTDPGWADRNRRLGVNVLESVVDGINFGSLLEEYGTPYYLKIDIEGADLLCLKGLLEATDRPRFVSIESSKVSFEALMEEFWLFRRLGYFRYKIIPQHRIAEQTLPNPPNEGKYISHRFAEGCSGAFGQELPGEWVRLEEAVRQYLAIFRKYRLTGDAGSLSGAVRGVLNIGRNGARSRLGTAARTVLRSVGTKLGLRPGWYDTHAMRDD